MRPGTGAGAARGMTASMRVGTASAGAGLVGGAGADVHIAARPATQQGLAMRGATAGPGRQVQDVSYFAGLLRSRISEIAAECARMRAETDRAGRDASLSVQLERRYEGAIKEVRVLEGELADYNLAMDKARTNVDAPEIAAFLSGVKRRNEATAREVDAVFIERQERERGSARLEEQIAELQRVSDARIASLPPAAVSEYTALVSENAALSAEVEKKQGVLEGVNAQVEAAEDALRRDKVRNEFAAAEKVLAGFKRDQAQLTEELAVAKLDPAAAREKLLAKVKDDNARMQSIDKQLRAAEETIASRKKAIAELTAEIEERKGEAGDTAKYEALFKRDAEMTEFIDRFPEMCDKERAEQRRTQDTIVALLEHISEGIQREKYLPSKEQADDAKDDLAEKKRELKASEMTAERLQEELALRQTEMEKIGTLEEKITAELTGLRARMEAFDAERPRFADIDGLRIAADNARGVLKHAISVYAERRDALRPAAAAAERALDAKRAALAALPQAAAIDAAEAQLRTAEASVFALKEYIATVGRESDFEPVRDDALKLLQELNVWVSTRAVNAMMMA